MLKVHVMRAEDLDQVVRLAAQLGYPTTLEDVKKRFEAILPLESHRIMVAKSTSGVVVGWIHMVTENHSLLGGPRAEVAALIVDETCRGQGVGKKLLEAGEHWAMQRGLWLVRVRSSVHREEAHRFYQGSGYVHQKSSHVFTKDMDG